MTPKFFAVINNPGETQRDHRLSALTEEKALKEAEKFKGSLLVGGQVHVIRNGVGEVGAFGRDGQVVRHGS